MVDTRRTYLWETSVPWASQSSHNLVQFNPNEDKCYLLTPFLTLAPKKFLTEGIGAIARNANINLQAIVVFSKPDIQHHSRRQQFGELLTKMDTIQRQWIDQILRELAETAGFSDIYRQDYSGYFEDFKEYLYFKGEKYGPLDISSVKIVSFINIKNELLAFLGRPYYI